MVEVEVGRRSERVAAGLAERAVDAARAERCEQRVERLRVRAGEREHAAALTHERRQPTGVRDRRRAHQDHGVDVVEVRTGERALGDLVEGDAARLGGHAERQRHEVGPLAVAPHDEDAGRRRHAERDVAGVVPLGRVRLDADLAAQPAARGRRDGEPGPHGLVRDHINGRFGDTLAVQQQRRADRARPAAVADDRRLDLDRPAWLDDPADDADVRHGRVDLAARAEREQRHVHAVRQRGARRVRKRGRLEVAYDDDLASRVDRAVEQAPGPRDGRRERLGAGERGRRGERVEDWAGRGVRDRAELGRPRDGQERPLVAAPGRLHDRRAEPAGLVEERALGVAERHRPAVVEDEDEAPGRALFEDARVGRPRRAREGEHEEQDGERAERQQEPLADADAAHGRGLDLADEPERREVDALRPAEVEQVDDDRDRRRREADQEERIQKAHGRRT